MRLTRCFSPAPLAAGTVVELPASAAGHLLRVLRLRAGDLLTLFDGRGGEYAARLLPGERSRACAEVGEHRPIEREPGLHLVLLQCLARGERMDWVVQKATELGVSHIVPIASRYSLVHLDAGAQQRRHAHWCSIAIGACEQSGRNRLPVVLPIANLADAVRAVEAPLQRLWLSPEAPQSLPAALAARAGGFALLVGPEGGLSEDEQLVLAHERFTPCRLGPRILRAETAPIAALAALLALAGDFA